MLVSLARIEMNQRLAYVVRLLIEITRNSTLSLKQLQRRVTAELRENCSLHRSFLRNLAKSLSSVKEIFFQRLIRKIKKLLKIEEMRRNVLIDDEMVRYEKMKG